MKNNINFVKLKNYFLTVSIILIILSLWFIFGPKKLNLGIFSPKGFNLAIDFQGGISQRITVYSGISIEKMRELAKNSGLSDNVQEVILRDREIIGKSTSFIIKTILTDEEKKKIEDSKNSENPLTPAMVLQEKTDKLFENIQKEYGKEYSLKGEELEKAKKYRDVKNINGVIYAFDDEVILNNVVRESVNTISPSFSTKMRNDALFLIIFVLIIMLIYITFRFKFEYAIGAILALIHDTIITLGVVSFMQIELDLTVVAAVLTMIGYSINDTIVIFDRIRENYSILKDEHPKDIFNISINQTIARSIITSLTTLLAVVAIVLFGGNKIFGFSFTFFVGVVIGTYSSIVIAGPITYIWVLNFSKKKLEFKKMEEAKIKNEKNEKTETENNTEKTNNTNEFDNVTVSKKTLKRLLNNKK